MKSFIKRGIVLLCLYYAARNNTSKMHQIRRLFYELLYSIYNIDFDLFYENIRWEYVMEYSKDICSLLGSTKSPPGSVIEDPKTILKVNLPIFVWVSCFQVIGDNY